MDPLAHRVASRYLQALGSPDALLHKTEAAAHRAAEMLRAVEQQHKFWMSSIPEGNTAAAEKAQNKLMALLKSYEHEVTDAMGALFEYDELEAHQGNAA